MLPAPPSSCAGWWFAQLWRAVLRHRPDRHTIWLVGYPEPGEAVFQPYGGPETGIETISGALHEGADRHLAVTWEWPGEDGMLHSMRLLWQPGEVYKLRGHSFALFINRAPEAPAIARVEETLTEFDCTGPKVDQDVPPS